MSNRTCRTRLLAGAVIVLALASTGAPMWAQEGAGLVQSGDTPDLFLLYTGDVIGYLDPCG